MNEISSWKRAKSDVEDKMLREEEELDYEIELEEEERLLESRSSDRDSDQDSGKSCFDDDSSSKSKEQSPESSESEESSPDDDSKSTSNSKSSAQSKPNFRERMNYLKCRITYANSFRNNYRYFDTTANFCDTSDEESEIDETNLRQDLINSKGPEFSKVTYDEQDQNSYDKVDKDYPECPINYLTHNNNKETSNTTNIFNEKNYTYDDVLTNSHIIVQSPTKSKNNSPNFLQKNSEAELSTKIYHDQNDTHTDPAETMPTANISYDDNNTCGDVSTNKQINLVFQPLESVQTPNKPKNKSASHCKLNVLADESLKIMQGKIKSKTNSRNIVKKNASTIEPDASESSSGKKSEEPIELSKFTKDISQTVTSTTKNTSTATTQSLKIFSENLPKCNKERPTNFQIQLKGTERSLLPTPQLPQVKNTPQPSQRIPKKKPFAKKGIFEEWCISFNINDISWYAPSYDAEDAKEETSSAESSGNFKVPLKRPPFKPNWSTSISSLGVLGNKCTKQPKEDNSDVMSLLVSVSSLRTSNGSDDGEDDKPLDTDINDKLDYVNTWVNNQQGRIPSVYKGLCYNHFFNNKYCNNNRCINQHSLTVHFAKNCHLNRVAKDEIDAALAFAISIPSFFEQVLSFFAELFSHRDNKEKLLYLVHQIFKIDVRINQVNALNTVLINLQQTDLETFKESVEYVLMQVGFKSYASLGPTLVDIIISLEDLPSYWPIIRRMITGGLILPMNVATKFLLKLSKWPVDLNICRDAYALILKYKFVNLPLVNSEIRDSFLLLIKPARKESNIELEENKSYNGINSTAIHNFSEPASDFLPVPQNVPKFDRPNPAYNPPNCYENSNVMSENMFALNSNNRIDFASLSRRETLVFEPPLLNGEDRVYRPKQRDCVYRGPPRVPNKNIDKWIPNPCSSDDNSLKEDIHTIPPQNRFPDRSGLTYNREGLHYDPLNDYVQTNDYVPQLKRKHQQTQPRNEEYNGFSRNNFEPPQKKFHLQPARFTASTFKNIDIVNSEFDGSNEGIAAAKPKPDVRYSKPPEDPVFGKLCFNPGYKLDVSLHNLYVHKIGSVTINEEDVILLNEILLQGNGSKFLNLIEKYQNPFTIENLISMTLAHLKSMHQKMARVWNRMLDSIARAEPMYYGSVPIRVVLEVITMNLLFVLIKKNLYLEAKDFLMKFTDWDSLVTSRIFVIHMQVHLSIAGRYLFIAKLVQAYKPELCHAILTCPKFNFMEHCKMWPYYDKETKMSTMKMDLNSRNSVLTFFFQKSFLVNIVVVTDLYKMALSRVEGIWKFDVIPYINTMVECLLNQKEISALKYIYTESNLYFNYMDVNILKQFLILMFSHLPESDGFRIFDKCASRSLYEPICTNNILRENIVIKSTLTPKEIGIILKCCFYKLMETNYVPSGGFKFWIKLTSNSGGLADEEISSLANRDIDKKNAINTVKSKVIRMLDEFFQIRGRTTPDLCVVEVARDDLIIFLQGPKYF